jgi:ribonuclease HII
VEEIDRINILRASLLAMRRASNSFLSKPHEVLVDGLHCPTVRFPVRAIVDGDALVAEISAASILAKTARDALMVQLHDPLSRIRIRQTTKAIHARKHWKLCNASHCPIHRRSFGPCARFVSTSGTKSLNPNAEAQRTQRTQRKN